MAEKRPERIVADAIRAAVGTADYVATVIVEDLRAAGYFTKRPEKGPGHESPRLAARRRQAEMGGEDETIAEHKALRKRVEALEAENHALRNPCACKRQCGDFDPEGPGVCKWPEQWPSNRRQAWAKLAEAERRVEILEAQRDEALTCVEQMRTRREGSSADLPWDELLAILSGERDA